MRQFIHFLKRLSNLGLGGRLKLCKGGVHVRQFPPQNGHHVGLKQATKL